MTYLSPLARYRTMTLRAFAVGAVLSFAAAMYLVLAPPVSLWGRIAVIAVLVIGLIALALAMRTFRFATKWNELRRAGWKVCDVGVVPDLAREQQAKILMDTTDGKWRLAIVDYPLEARDLLMADPQIAYVGEFADRKPVLIRPADPDGSPYEAFAFARSRAGLDAG